MCLYFCYVILSKILSCVLFCVFMGGRGVTGQDPCGAPQALLPVDFTKAFSGLQQEDGDSPLDMVTAVTQVSLHAHSRLGNVPVPNVLCGPHDTRSCHAYLHGLLPRRNLDMHEGLLPHNVLRLVSWSTATFCVVLRDVFCICICIFPLHLPYSCVFTFGTRPT